MNITRYLVLFFIFILSSHSYAREQIRMVGSSTVYPFATVLAENFHNKNKQFKTPMIEATGTGGGVKLFCQGVGMKYPDIVNASREIKPVEVETCKNNGVENIIQIIIGYDAIVMIHPKSLGNIKLTQKQIFLSLATKIPDINGNLIDNPYKKWSEIDSSLPSIPIKVMGPPSTSGTRDSFIELAMDSGCKAFEKERGQLVKMSCKDIREDGAWINGGENDLLLMSKVVESTSTFAIMGYSFYAQNQNNVAAVLVDGVAPNRESFNDNLYPLFRPLFMYVKGEHLRIISGLREFITETISVNAIGENGYLIKRGIIPLSNKDYTKMIQSINIK